MTTNAPRTVTGLAITYDAKTNNFVIDCPFMLNEYIRQLPSRKYHQGLRRWLVPAVMVNVRVLDGLRAAGLTMATDTAAMLALERVRENATPRRRERFPLTYQFPLGITPMPHQRTALDLAWDTQGFGLFMDMGTGKTLVGVTLACARFNVGEHDRLLVLAPLSVRRTWVGPGSEFEKYATVPYDYLLLDSARPDAFVKWLKIADGSKLRVLVASIEGLGISARQFNMCAQFMQERCFGHAMIVSDESSRIKNPDAMRTKRAIALSGQAKTRLIMNGTPIAKGVEDLYAQIQFLSPDILGTGSYYSFRNRYCVMGGFEGKQIVAYRNMDELTQSLAPWTYEVRKADVLHDLPPKVYERRWVKPTAQQKALLDFIRKTPLQPDPQSGDIPLKNVLERLLRMQQIVGGFYTTVSEDGLGTVSHSVAGGNPKVSDLMGMLEEITGKVVIWARYRPEIAMLADHVSQRYGPLSVVQYHGGVSEDDRKRGLERFQTNPTTRFFIGNQSTGGLGIDATAATTEVYYSNSFAFIDRQQSEDRAHRKGQTKSVTIVDLGMEGTVDELVLDALAHKADVDRFVREALAARREDLKTLI